MTSPSAKTKPLNSLRSRLFVSAVLIIVLILPMIGITLSDAVERQVMSAVKNELNAYFYSVLAVAEVEEQTLVMPEALLENQFNLVQSGLYTVITRPNPSSNKLSKPKPPHIAWQSASVIGIELPQYWPTPSVGKSAFQEIWFNGAMHHLYSFSVNFTSATTQVPLTIHIVQDQITSTEQIDAFSNKLWLWLSFLMVFLSIIQFSWLAWTLKPLKKFKQELAWVETGEAEQLSQDYPTELQDVARQLNTLLTTEQNQRKRYRNALSDLAHSLKTPLAVIQSQADLNQSSMEQVDNINHIIGHQLKRAQTAAGSAWHLGIGVENIAQKLARTLAKIYREPAIHIALDVENGAVFKGDEADLTEILGNLLDNACKAAKATVNLKVYQEQSLLVFEIGDDGQGVSPEQQDKIIQRGIRADSYQNGHGIGLAIVSDLVDSYQGQLTISRSTDLGGALFRCQFPR